MATPSTLGSHENASVLQVEVGYLAAQPLGPGPQLRLVEGVVEAHHRHPVADLGWNSPTGRAAHRAASASRAWPARDGPPRAAQLARPGGRTRRRGSPARRACGSSSLWCSISARSSAARAAASGRDLASAGGHGQAAMPAPTTASGSARRRAPPSGPAPPGAAARRSARPARRRRPRPRRTGAGRPCALTWATARSPATSGRSTQVSEAAGRAAPTCTRLGRAADGDPARRHVDGDHVAALRRRSRGPCPGAGPP